MAGLLCGVEKSGTEIESEDMYERERELEVRIMIVRAEGVLRLGLWGNA